MLWRLPGRFGRVTRPVTIAGGTGDYTLSTGLTNSGKVIIVDGALGIRNRVINPSGQVQQTAAGTVADGGYSSMDQWIVLTQTGTVADSQLVNPESGTPYMLRLTQSQAVAQRMGLIQWIERANCIDLRGQTVTLSARVRLSTAPHLRIAIVEWTGTADSITKDVVNDWTSSSYIVTAFFNSTTTTIAGVSGSLTAADSGVFGTVSITAAISTAANNIAVFLWSEGTMVQNATMDVGRVQLEIASSTTPIAFRPYSLELMLCQRYFYRKNSGGTQDYLANLQAYSSSAAAGKLFDLPLNMRTPTVSASNAGHLSALTSGGGAFNAFTATGLSVGGGGPYHVIAAPTGSSGLAAGDCTAVGFNSAAAYIDANGRL
jgi:hypothetical protein